MKEDYGRLAANQVIEIYHPNWGYHQNTKMVKAAQRIDFF